MNREVQPASLRAFLFFCIWYRFFGSSLGVIMTGVPLVNFSENAVKRIEQVLREEDNPHLRLRIFAHGGGCSGMQYGFAFDETKADDDTEFCVGGFKVLIDALSLQYLAGSDVDYTESLEGSRFVIKNPNATSSCGCGQSFSV